MTNIGSGAETQEANMKCSLCLCKLNAAEKDDFEREICGSCKLHPDALRKDSPVTLLQPHVVKPINSKYSRTFTEAEKALIRKVHRYMPAEQLLAVLNE